MTATVLRNVLFYVFKFTNLYIIILKFFGNMLELVFITYLFFLQNYIFGICFFYNFNKIWYFSIGVFLCVFMFLFFLFDILVFLASSQISVFSFGVFGNILELVFLRFSPWVGVHLILLYFSRISLLTPNIFFCWWWTVGGGRCHFGIQYSL